MTGQAAGLVICAVGFVVGGWMTLLGVRDRRREQKRVEHYLDRDGR